MPRSHGLHMSLLLGWRALGKRSEEFDDCISQLQFGELFNEGFFSALEKSLSYCFVEGHLETVFGPIESRGFLSKIFIFLGK